MAEFIPAFEATMLAEGGYKLTNDPVDRGGQTYGGISRRFHPKWEGWAYIDQGQTPPAQLVQNFYRVEFWDRIRGDAIVSPDIAEDIYDFAVNAGVRAAVRLAQGVVDVPQDGIPGSLTIGAINAADARGFKTAYALAKVEYYRDIVSRDASQSRFLLGWLNRVIKVAA